MKELLRRNQPLVIACVALVAFLLGAVGMRMHMAALGLPFSWTDAIYFSLRLFHFEYDFGGKDGFPYAADNALLDIARFLAPATLTFVIVKTVMQFASRQVEVLRISRLDGHAVVCGAGERGRRLALALRAEGRQVVVIENDEDAEALAELRQEGVHVVVGSAMDRDHQAEARLEHASLVVAVTASEDANLQVVLDASRSGVKRPLRAFAHAKRSFAEMFESQPPFRSIENGREFRFFDHSAAAARILVKEHAPELVGRLLEEQRPARILIVGDGEVLPELLGAVVALCQYATESPPIIDLVTSDPEGVAYHFPVQHPQLALVADLRVHPLQQHEMQRVDLAGLLSQENVLEFDLVYVACREDKETLAIGRSLVQQPCCLRGEVVAALRPSTPWIRLFNEKPLVPGVRLHDLVQAGCSAGVVLGGELDAKAREIHEKYYADKRKQGKPEGSTPALVPWEKLPEEFRQDNRSQADLIPLKQATFAASPTPETRELLAIAEHRRWVAQKILGGWRYGALRDDARRLHPDMVPYEQLNEDVKAWDRSAVDTALADMPVVAK